MTHSFGKNNKITLKKKKLAVKSPWKHVAVEFFREIFSVWCMRKAADFVYTLFDFSPRAVFATWVTEEEQRKYGLCPPLKARDFLFNGTTGRSKTGVCVCVHCVVLVSDPKNNTINVRLWTVILNGGGG